MLLSKFQNFIFVNRPIGHAVKCGQKKTGKKRGKSKKKLNCNLCSETTTTVKAMREHRRKVHAQLLEETVFSCTICAKTFFHAKNFKIHMISHKKAKGVHKCNLLFFSHTSYFDFFYTGKFRKKFLIEKTRNFSYFHLILSQLFSVNFWKPCFWQVKMTQTKQKFHTHRATW